MKLFIYILLYCSLIFNTFCCFLPRNQLETLLWNIKSENTDFIMFNYAFKINKPALYLSSQKQIPSDIPIYFHGKRYKIFVNAFNQQDLFSIISIIKQQVPTWWKCEFFIMTTQDLTFKYLKNYMMSEEQIFNVVYIAWDEFKGNISTIKTKLRSSAVRKQTSFNLCYYASRPYTLLKKKCLGIEQQIMKLVFGQLKIKITHKKYENRPNCGLPPFLSKGIFDNLLNHSCDSVIGTSPCPWHTPLFEITNTFLEDGVILVVPNSECPRKLGAIILNSKVLVTILVNYLSMNVPLLILCLIQTKNRGFLKSLYRSKKLRFSLLGVSLLTLSNIVITGIFQGEIFNSLVKRDRSCQLKNLNDVIDRNLTIGLEALIANNTIYTSGIYKPTDRCWSVDKDTSTLDPLKPHILRKVRFDYFTANYLPNFVTENGDELKLKPVQTLKRGQNGMFLYKDHPLLHDINKGISLVSQSGLDEVIIKKTVGFDRIIRYVKRTHLVNRYTPVKLNEIKWLLMCWAEGMLIGCLVLIFEKFWKKRTSRLNYLK